jgi:hypothetical protein
MASTNVSTTLHATRQTASVKVLVIAGAVCFTCIVIALHFLRPDLDPIGQPASRYAVGPYAILMTIAFFCLSMASGALVVGLSQALSPRARSGAGLTFLALWAAGVFVSMIFPMDAEEAAKTLAGAIHNIAGPLTFLSMSIGTILLSWRFKLDDHWQSLHRSALVLSLVIMVGFVATFLSFIMHSGLLGVLQRITLAAIITWILLAGAHLRSGR